MTKFEPKGKDELRQEVIEKYGLSEEENADLIEKIVEDRYKDEQFKASEKKKVTKTRELLDKMVKAKEYYKKGGGIKPKGVESSISTEDKAYLFAKGMSRTEVRHLEKVMKATGKNWEDAANDNLFKTWKRENDALIKRRGAQLDPSSGGSSGKVKTDHDKMVEKFSQNLPKGFSIKKKK